MAESSAMNHTGLSEAECKEIHGYFMRGAQMWGAVAVIAHVLVYQWLPWFPG